MTVVVLGNQSWHEAYGCDGAVVIHFDAPCSSAPQTQQIHVSGTMVGVATVRV